MKVLIQNRPDSEIKSICEELSRITQSDEELKLKIYERLGRHAAVTSTSSGRMRMVMGMVIGDSGKIISF